MSRVILLMVWLHAGLPPHTVRVEMSTETPVFQNSANTPTSALRCKTAAREAAEKVIPALRSKPTRIHYYCENEA